MLLPALNLPPFAYRIHKDGDKKLIYDQLRKKFLILTPEEWVRQHFIHFMLSKGYPAGLIAIETGTRVYKKSGRTDIMVYFRSGQPFMLVECKAPGVNINQRTFDQAAAYNLAIKAPFMVITNGLQHYFCQVDTSQKKYNFLPELPVFPKPTEE